MNQYKFTLLNGNFTKDEAISILSKMVQVKIQFHEDKINHTSNEEDIKMRENRIRQLQNDLADTRLFMENQEGRIPLKCEICLH